MNNRKKALLLSALIFPGSGHFLMNKKHTAWTLIISASIILIIYTYTVMQHALEIIEQIKRGEIRVLDVTQLTQQLTQHDGMTGTLPIIFLLIWLFALIDILRIKP